MHWLNYLLFSSSIRVAATSPLVDSDTLRHALLSPVTSMQSVLSELDQVESTPKVRRNLQIIHQRLVSLLHPHQTPAKTDLIAIVSRAVTFVRIKYPAARLSFAAAEEQLPVSLHEVWWEEMMVCLLSNACEAYPNQRGPVSVLVNASKTKLTITITDSGRGMHWGEQMICWLPRITFKPNGTGVGLSVVRDLVKEYQGSIDMKSSLGKGTTIQLTFPITELNRDQRS